MTTVAVSIPHNKYQDNLKKWRKMWFVAVVAVRTSFMFIIFFVLPRRRLVVVKKFVVERNEWSDDDVEES